MQQVVGVVDGRHERLAIPPAVASRSAMAGDRSVDLGEPSPQWCRKADRETRAKLLTRAASHGCRPASGRAWAAIRRRSRSPRTEYGPPADRTTGNFTLLTPRRYSQRLRPSIADAT
jgi:hypothetical protein